MSAMLYELTASAAQMCTPLPAAASGGLAGWLDHWQTLLGAAIGGGMGVAGAWIVAASSRSREQRIAAGMVLPDLHQLAAAGLAYEKALGDAPDAKGDKQAQAFFAKARMLDTLRRLSKRRPVPFALHTPSIGQLSDLDARLYSHLFQCQMIHREFESLMAARRPFGDDPLDTDEHDLQRYTDWKLCVEHAMLAASFLDLFVFASWPRRIMNRYRLRPRNTSDHPVIAYDDFRGRSSYLLATGEIRPAPKTDNAEAS